MDNIDAQKIINKTIADYNKIAAKFSSTRSRLTPDILNLVEAAEVGESDKILDYGCGNGRLAQLFKPEQYLGVDPSIELIKYARSLHPDHRFDLIKPCAMPESGEYDAIFCLAMIHHLPDLQSQKELLTNFQTILKPCGKLILTSWHIDDSNRITEIPFKSNSVTIKRDIFSFSLANLSQIIKEAGFNISSSKIVPRNRGSFSNLEIIATKK